MPSLSLSNSTIKRINRQYRQRVAATGREDSNYLNSLFEAATAAGADKVIQAGQLEQRNKEFEERKRQFDITTEANRRAARASGAIQIGSTAIQAAISPKGSEIIGNIAAGRGPFTGPTTTTKVIQGGGTVLPTAPSPGGAAPNLATTSAQAITAGALTRTPAELAISDAAGFTGGEFAVEAGAETTAPGIASTVGIPALAGKVGGEVAKLLPIGQGETTQRVKGAAGGALAGFVASGGNPIGAIIGAIAGGTVICEELQRQGYLSKEAMILDGKFREFFISKDTYEGYMTWAPTVVKLMKRSRMVTNIVKPFGVAWAHEMASRMDSSYLGNDLGTVMLKVGVPICSAIGKIRGFVMNYNKKGIKKGKTVAFK